MTSSQWSELAERAPGPKPTPRNVPNRNSFNLAVTVAPRRHQVPSLEPGKSRAARVGLLHRAIMASKFGQTAVKKEAPAQTPPGPLVNAP
jgi:hypothetical protein